MTTFLRQAESDPQYQEYTDLAGAYRVQQQAGAVQQQAQQMQDDAEQTLAHHALAVFQQVGEHAQRLQQEGEQQLLAQAQRAADYYQQHYQDVAAQYEARGEQAPDTTAQMAATRQEYQGTRLPDETDTIAPRAPTVGERLHDVGGVLGGIAQQTAGDYTAGLEQGKAAIRQAAGAGAARVAENVPALRAAVGRGDVGSALGSAAQTALGASEVAFSPIAGLEGAVEGTLSHAQALPPEAVHALGQVTGFVAGGGVQGLHDVGRLARATPGIVRSLGELTGGSAEVAPAVAHALSAVGARGVTAAQEVGRAVAGGARDLASVVGSANEALPEARLGVVRGNPAATTTRIADEFGTTGNDLRRAAREGRLSTDSLIAGGVPETEAPSVLEFLQRTQEAPLPDGVGARYDPSQNVILVPIGGRVSPGTYAHEQVHWEWANRLTDADKREWAEVLDRRPGLRDVLFRRYLGSHAAEGIPVHEEVLAELADQYQTRGTLEGIPDDVAVAARRLIGEAPGGTPGQRPSPAASGIVSGGTRGGPDVAPPFYSALERAVQTRMPNRATPDQVAAIVSPANGVKPDELKWTGFDDFLAQARAAGRPVTKQEALDFLQANQVRVQEVVKGAPGAPFTKFGPYTLPGGAPDTYRELLLTLPQEPPRMADNVRPSEAVVARYQPQWDALLGRLRQIRDQMDLVGRRADGMASPEWARLEGERSSVERAMAALHGRMAQETLETARPGAPSRTTGMYRSSHWDEPNVLAHVRFNDRVTPGPDGKPLKTLFVEEIQSDWHQAGREKGYRTPDMAARIAQARADQEAAFRAGDNAALTDAMQRQFALEQASVVGVPDAPFAKTWPELAMKRVIRWAAEHGYDRVAFTTGEQQAARYDLSKQIAAVAYSGTNLKAFDLDGNEVIARTGVTPAELPGIIGRELSERLLAQPPRGTLRMLEGVNVQVGGEGMKAFYDRMLPEVANKLGKKFGARVGATTIETGTGAEPVHYFDIPPAMRQSVMQEGQPLFLQSGAPTSAADTSLPTLLRGAAGNPLVTAGDVTRGRIGAVAGGLTGAATGPDDQTPEQRLERGAVGAFLGGTGAMAAGPLVRNVGRYGEALGAAAKAGIVPSAPRESVGEAIDRVASMLDQGVPKQAPSTAIEKAVTGALTHFRAAAFDQLAPLQRVQSMVYGALGRAPTLEEDAYLQARLYAGRAEAAAQRVKDDLLPALTPLHKGEDRLLNTYLAMADNADKASSVGARVEARAAAANQAAVKKAADMVVGSAWAQSAEPAAVQRVEQLAHNWDDAQRRLGEVETRLAFLRENATSPIERPPWAAGRGGRRPWSDASLADLAERSGLNPYEPGWWQAVDDETLRLYRAEANPIGQTTKALRDEARKLRAERRAVQQEIANIDQGTERRLVELGAVLDQQARAGTAQQRLLDLAKSTQDAGTEAAANRLFSGNVHAHDLPAVDATFTQRYGPEVAQRVREAAQGVWDFTASLRQRMADSGLISQETAQQWAQQFPHYVRSEILKYLPEQGGSGFTGSKAFATIADTGIRALTEEGTAAARDKPLNSVMRQAFAVEAAARRNETAQAVLKLRDNNAELQQLLVPRKPGTVLTERPDQTVFSVFVDGKRRQYVAPKSLEGLFRLDPPQIPHVVQTALDLVTLAPVMRAGATGLNALFIPTNAVRDAMQYMVRSGGFSSAGGFTRSGRRLASAYLDSLRGAGAEEALRAGAGTASEFSGMAPEEALRRLTGEGLLGGRVRPVRRLSDLLGAAQDVALLPLAPARLLGERVEQAPRLAAYRLAREAGASPERAALAWRDVTLDFSRGGAWAKLVNRVIPFFNVAVQGGERLFSLDLAKGNRLNTAIGLTTGVLLPSLAAEAWNRTNYPDDYANVPNYLKDTGIVIMLPVTPKANADGTAGQRPYLWLPMPQEYNFLRVTQATALDQALGTNRRGWQDALTAVLGQLSPVGTEGMPAPPLMKTALELQANRDLYRGRQIIPDATLALPVEQQATAGTSALGRALGPVLHKPPAAIDYAVTSLGGGVGRQALAASDLMARTVGAPTSTASHPPVVDVPVVGGLVGTLLRNQGGQQGEYARRDVGARADADKRRLLERLRQSASYQRADGRTQQLYEQRLAAQIDAAYAPLRRAATVAPGPRAGAAR